MPGTSNGFLIRDSRIFEAYSVAVTSHHSAVVAQQKNGSRNYLERSSHIQQYTAVQQCECCCGLRLSRLCGCQQYSITPLYRAIRRRDAAGFISCFEKGVCFHYTAALGTCAVFRGVHGNQDLIW